MKLAISSVELFGLIFSPYKHQTSIKTMREKKTAHTHRTPERSDQRGAAEHPEKASLKGQGGKKRERKVG